MMSAMPNIATILKSEISRIARKEVRTETQDFKKASAQYRSHIASLRKRIDQLERDLKRTKKTVIAKPAQRPAESESDGVQRRFSATRLAATRKKLGLSAADFATLVGVSGLSIYNWESGKARPRQQQLDALASVRGLGKREAAERLLVLQAAR